MRRRHFLAGSVAVTGALATGRATSGYRLSRDAFSLGVASGELTDESFVLWTRIAPEPLQPDGGVDNVMIPVTWEVATEPDMKNVIRRGTYPAVPGLAHSVHVDVRNLTPGRDYWYRFAVKGQFSPIGRTKTLPRHASGGMRLVTTSCQNYTHGYFVAYDHMVADEPDFVIHLGDYIYDTSFGETFRQHDAEKAPQSLSEFRRRHALYKTDRSLQYAHANVPFYCVIDNHDAIEDNDPSLYRQRAAAYQAWYEHMPVRGFSLRAPNQMRMHRRIQIGQLAQICLLDTRQYRDTKELCRDNLDKAVGFGNYRERCDDIFEEQRSMLGSQQEAWLYRSLRDNRCAWNVIASSGPVLPYRIDVDNEPFGYIGAWDAYPANRRRLIEAVNQAKTGRAVILSGDLHSFWAMDGRKVDQSSERMPAIEFVCSSLSANWPEPLSKPVSDNLDNNPHVSFYEGAERGYLLHDVNEESWQTSFKAVGDARRLDADVRNIRIYSIDRDSFELQALAR